MDRRSSERFQPDDLDEIQVRLEMADGTMVSVVILDCSEGGLRVGFEQCAAPTFEIASEQRAHVELLQARENFVRRARIVGRNDSDTWRHYNLQFLQTDEERMKSRAEIPLRMGIL